MLTTLIVSVISGLLFIVAAIPLIGRRVGPNGLYGFRLSKTLNNPDIWYDTNEYGGRYLLGVGLVTIVAAIILYFIPGLSAEVYAILVVGILILGVVVMIVATLRYLSTLQ